MLCHKQPLGGANPQSSSTGENCREQENGSHRGGTAE